MEDPRTKEEKEAGLTYEEMMKKRKAEAQKEKEEKLKPKDKKEPEVTAEVISYGEPVNGEDS